jgi:hypothetical protein
MLSSAGLIVAALLLFAAQGLWNDGTMLTFVAGFVALIAGVGLGLVRGDRQYRAAVGLAVLGTILVVQGFTTYQEIAGGFALGPTTMSEVAVLIGGLIWLAALFIGALALIRPRYPQRS